MATKMDAARIQDLGDRCQEFADVAQNESVEISDAGETLGEISRAEFRYLAAVLQAFGPKHAVVAKDID